MLSGVEASDIYEYFRWESSAIHMSLLALATNVHQLDADAGRVTVGGPNHPVDRGKRLFLALDMLGRISRVIIMGMRLDLEAWEAVYAVTFMELMELLSPLVEEEVRHSET